MSFPVEREALHLPGAMIRNPCFLLATRCVGYYPLFEALRGPGRQPCYDVLRYLGLAISST
eukprot:3494280-Pleurochrysis_carterae.AAC.2